MSQDGRAVSNFILDFCSDKDRIITNLSLQKVIYFCHAWSLIERDQPLIKHQFEAWEYGPVLQYIYRDFKEYGDNPITGRAKKIDPLTGEKRVVTYSFDEETKALLDRIVNFYSQLSAGELVKLSHVKNGPWYQTWNHAEQINPGMKINDEKIVEFYSMVKSPFSIQ